MARPTDSGGGYHPAMEASTHGRIRIEAFEVARFSHPAGGPLAGRTGIVMAYAVVHPAGLLLFDTGIGTGEADIEEAYHPVVQDLRSLLARPRPRAGRCRRARVLAPPLRPRRPERRLPGSPDPRPGGRARGGTSAGLHDRRVGRLPRRTLHRGGRRDGAPSGCPAHPDARPHTRPPVAGRRRRGRADRARRAGPLHASGVGWRERAGRVRPRERVGSGRLPCIRGASASAPARRRSVRSRQVGGSIRVRVRYSDLWGCVVSTGPGYRGTRAEDATGPR